MISPIFKNPRNYLTQKSSNKSSYTRSTPVTNTYQHLDSPVTWLLQLTTWSWPPKVPEFPLLSTGIRAPTSDFRSIFKHHGESWEVQSFFTKRWPFFQLFVGCWIFREIFKHQWCFLFEISLCTFCKDHRYTMIQHGNMEDPHGTARHNKAAHLDQRWGNASAETCLLTHFLNQNPSDPLV